MKHFFAMVASLMLLASCARSMKPTKEDVYIAKKIQKKDTATLDFIRLQEAKMSDIPIPLSAQPITKYFDPIGSSMFGYKDKLLSMADMLNFYIQEMERLGWQIEEQFLGYETQLRFIKPPDRSCLISIRSDEKNEQIKFVICSGSRSELIA